MRFFIPIVAALFVGAPLLAAAAATEPDLAGKVEAAAALAASEHVAAPDRLEVLSSRFTGGDPVPAGALEAEPLEVEGPTEAGMFRVKLRLLSDGVPCGEANAAVRGLIMGPALVARRALLRGSAVPEDAVEIVDTDLTRVEGTPLRDRIALAGRVPVRALSVGRVLTPDLFTGAVVIRRGQVVELKVRRGSLVVTARGTAKRDGATGDTVTAENTATRAIVLGRVQPDGSIEVIGRAESTRRLGP